MIKPKINAKFLFDEKGNKTDVLLDIEDFEKLMEELQDLKDLTTVYERKSKNLKPIPLEKVRKELFGNDTKK